MHLLKIALDQASRTFARSMALGVIATLLTAPAIAENALRVYPIPMSLMYQLHNDDYTVRVRTPGEPWQDLYEYRVRVDMDSPQSASMVYFDFKGTVELEIQKNNGRFTEVEVSPLSSTLKTERSESIVRLKLMKPERFSVQFDGDRLHNLHILAGDIPPPRPTGGNVRYFGPGEHQPPTGSRIFPVQSGDHIYLEGGAILRGSFDLTRLTGVTISGRGLVYDPGLAMELNGSVDIDIGDLIFVNSEREAAARVVNIRNSRNVKIREISAFTAGKWSDGINISTSQQVLVDGGYLRTSDDAVVVYAVTDCPICGTQPIAPVGPPGAKMPADTFDITIRNLRIWNDVAHALYVGHFGDNAVPRTIHNVTFENIDIANLDEDDPAWEGAIAIFSGDSTLIRDIVFSDIRVDRIEEGKLVHIVAGNNPRYNKMAGRGVDGVTLRNISYTGDGMPSKSVITGVSSSTAVRNITIRNLRIGGHAIRSAPEADIEVGPFVSELVVE